MNNFIPRESVDGVEQLKRSAAIATQNVARLRSQLENEPDEFTRSRLLKLLLYEAERSCRHIAELRELTCRQVELIEKDNLKGQIVEWAVKLLALLNDLMANYQTVRRRISPAVLRIGRGVFTMTRDSRPLCSVVVKEPDWVSGTTSLRKT
jgi:hypothetical protein